VKISSKSLRSLAVLLVNVCGACAALSQVDGGGEYHVHKTGTMVWDKQTGLVWMRCGLGQKWVGTCKGIPAEMNFAKAKALAQQLNAMGGYAGHQDWQLPTVRQLSTLRVCSRGFKPDTLALKDGGAPVPLVCSDDAMTPTIDSFAFPNTGTRSYWSSSKLLSGDYAWDISFFSGYVNISLLYNLNAVRLVRAHPLSSGAGRAGFSREVYDLQSDDILQRSR
jgi:Protein of unknown function (DUF1566)